MGCKLPPPGATFEARLVYSQKYGEVAITSPVKPENVYQHLGPAADADPKETFKRYAAISSGACRWPVLRRPRAASSRKCPSRSQSIRRCSASSKARSSRRRQGADSIAAWYWLNRDAMWQLRMDAQGKQWRSALPGPTRKSSAPPTYLLVYHFGAHDRAMPEWDKGNVKGLRGFHGGSAKGSLVVISLADMSVKCHAPFQAESSDTVSGKVLNNDLSRDLLLREDFAHNFYEATVASFKAMGAGFVMPGQIADRSRGSDDAPRGATRSWRLK